MNKIKNNLTDLIAAAMGLLTFVFFAIPYLKYAIEAYGREESRSSNGYHVLGMSGGLKVPDLGTFEDVGFTGVMSGILQILVLLVAIALLAWGVCRLLKAFGILTVLPDKIGVLDTAKISNLLLTAYAALNFLLLIFLIIFCVENQESQMGISAGFYPSAGIFITFILAAAAVVAPTVVNKITAAKAPEAVAETAEETAEETTAE